MPSLYKYKNVISDRNNDYSSVLHYKPHKPWDRSEIFRWAISLQHCENCLDYQWRSTTIKHRYQGRTEVWDGRSPLVPQCPTRPIECFVRRSETKVTGKIVAGIFVGLMMCSNGRCILWWFVDVLHAKCK